VVVASKLAFALVFVGFALTVFFLFRKCSGNMFINDMLAVRMHFCSGFFLPVFFFKFSRRSDSTDFIFLIANQNKYKYEIDWIQRGHTTLIHTKHRPDSRLDNWQVYFKSLFSIWLWSTCFFFSFEPRKFTFSFSFVSKMWKQFPILP
jgi:hypothetical protein